MKRVVQNDGSICLLVSRLQLYIPNSPLTYPGQVPFSVYIALSRAEDSLRECFRTTAHNSSRFHLYLPLYLSAPGGHRYTIFSGHLLLTRATAGWIYERMAGSEKDYMKKTIRWKRLKQEKLQTPKTDIEAV